ncbi:MAG: metallophosphoesterase [bacterium]
MKVFYTSDVHGDTNFYRELVTVCRDKQIDVLLVGGDLLPRKGHNNKSIIEQKKFIHNFLKKILTRIKDETAVEIYAIFGNNDWAAVLEDIRELEKAELVNLLHRTYFNLEDNLFISGYPFVPPTKFSPKDFEKRDLSEDKAVDLTTFPVISTNGRIKRIKEKVFLQDRPSIEDDLKEFIKYRENHPDQRMIYVMHSPPYGTMLDRLYNSQPAGSKAIKTFIEKTQPLITLHGHIHESPVISYKYQETIGSTISVNPGQVGGFLSGVLFNTDDPEKTMFHIQYDR